jgi:hypothetical protein
MAKGIRQDAEAMERRLASRELGKARRSIAAIRNFYLTNVILSLLIAVPTALSDGPMLWKALTGAVAAFMIAGYVQIAKDPFVWSLIIASIWSVLLAAAAYKGVLKMNLYTILGVLWTLGCWMMLPTTTRVNKLLAQYPDLWIAKKMTGRGQAPHKGRRTRRR